MINLKKVNVLLVAGAIILAGSVGSNGAVLYTDDFASGTDGWTGSGDWTFGYDTPNNRLQGQFGSQVTPSPESGYWSSPYIGDVTAGIYSLTEMVFDFYVGSVLPSSVMVTIGSGSDFVTRAITGLAIGNNTGVSVSLASAAGWSGSVGLFANILADIDYVDFEVMRNGSLASQSFGLDNFQLLGEEPGPPLTEAIPEPGVLNMMVLVAVAGLSLRRRWLANLRA